MSEEVKMFGLANFVIESLLLMPKSPLVEEKHDGVAAALNEVAAAREKVDESHAKREDARKKANRVRTLVRQCAQGAAPLLLVADPSLERELQALGGSPDPVVALEVTVRVAQKSPSDRARAIGEVLRTVLSDQVRAEKAETDVEADAASAESRARRAAVTLSSTAKDGELFIRENSPPGSPALLHLKRFYQRSESKPGKPTPAKPPPVTPAAVPPPTGPELSVPPVTTGATAPAANDAAPATPEGHTKVA